MLAYQHHHRHFFGCLLALLPLMLCIVTAPTPPPKPNNNNLLYMPGIHNFFAYNTSTGNVTWDYGGNVDYNSYMSQPIYVNKTLYTSDLFTVRALDPESGNEKWNWTLPPPQRIDSITPAVYR